MSFILLLIAFVLSGVSAIANKALIQWGLGAYLEIYMISFNGVAAILGGITILILRERGGKKDYSVGFLMGVAATLSGIFFLIALTHTTGIVAFPIRSLGNLVLTTLVSIFAWREKLSRIQWFGMALSLIAIWLIY